MTDFNSATETAELANVDEITTKPSVDDVIHIERKVGATQATVTLMNGQAISGGWAAGDLQAVRLLVRALMDLNEGTTARNAQYERQIADLITGGRIIRDQLRAALDDIDKMRTLRDTVAADTSRRIGELMAEITNLRAELGAAQPTLTPEAARAMRDDELAAANHEKGVLRQAFETERRRAETAIAAMREMKEEAESAAGRTENGATMVRGRLYSKAVDTTLAADQAFTEASWKEGNHYLRLANTWIALLNVVDSQPGLISDEPT